MKVWFFYALLAAGLWGVWGFFGKMASRTLTSQGLFCVASVGCIAALLLCLAFCAQSGTIRLKTVDSFYGLLSGFVLIMGLLFFYWALAAGEATRVVVITATYPLVTLLLAYFFMNETLTVKKIIGVVLAVSGIIFLSV